MITAYVKAHDGIHPVSLKDISDFPEEMVWLDLLEPSKSEEQIIESFLGIEVPTSQELSEIEDSSRFYRREDTIYLTASILARLESEQPSTTDIRFILTPAAVISVRYVDSKRFRLFTSRLTRGASQIQSSDLLMESMLELIVDDLADSLEATALDLDRLAHRVFFSGPTGKGEKGEKKVDLKEAITEIGKYGELVSEERLSVLNMNRLLIFLSQSGDGWWSPETKSRLQTLIRDVRSLTEHATFLANRVNFILDGTLGLINIEQNSIIKIFSVAAVVFLPPTLLASIYGMNFRAMPELGWEFGYPMALALMVISAILPYFYFKRRGWL
ncbi:magnesium transporter CorA family protein [Desulfomonile tiedjei]|uniref:Magnesium transport protein CorA n=1 Tax=Desulfomonile tiedjei (strain ATCC 49306 / DSM 6799 / DCB-1) TaxID=706587 RepID=I4C8P0_DESTA|nr:magnesium transporter CorA family protein [Desulfomonile tiedjei]AFM25931.1 Mg2+/Co2+ transporter [Desulfomonile tiedjei DSM 6799]